MPSANGQKDPKRAVLYTRVSSKGQAEDGYSLDGQLHEMRAFAEAQGWEVVGEPVVDAGEKRWMYNRPGLDRIKETAAQGGVDVVLAWRWDRFGESPWPELLAVELEEYGTKLRALDDSGEGEDAEILRVLKGQLAKKDQRQRVERSLMGKLSKVRQGEVLGVARRPRYGFRYVRNDKGRPVGYEPDREKMQVVARIFSLLAAGVSVHGVRRYLEQRGIPAPGGGRRWSRTTILGIVLDDCYRPHSYAEVRALVSPQVAATLDLAERYGVSWWGKRKTKYESFRSKKRVAEVNDRGEWVAVPVPASGIPREVVNAAREGIKGNPRVSSSGDRFWELSGGVFVCGGCGCRMLADRQRRRSSDRYYHYYRCPTRRRVDRDTCPVRRTAYRAEEVEEKVWRFVSDLMKDPERLREDLDAMIELERASARGDGWEREAKMWSEKLAKVDRKRSGFQDQAAEGLITLDELRVKLAALEETRETARRELEALEAREDRIRELERGRDAFLDSLEAAAPGVLEDLSPEERHPLYKMLGLRVVAKENGRFEASVAGGRRAYGIPNAHPHERPARLRKDDARS